MTDLGLKKASAIVGYVDVIGLNEFFTSPRPNAGGVAFSVLFHDFTPFSFRSVSAQEVAEVVFSIKSEAIGLDNVSLKFVKLLDPSLIPHITNFSSSAISIIRTYPCAYITSGVPQGSVL
jgi:hypothetical protein